MRRVCCRIHRSRQRFINGMCSDYRAVWRWYLLSSRLNRLRWLRKRH
eukprot:COSAG02_NODE_66754_length_254_cov_1.316129_1_plen_46_part_10